MTQIQIRRDTAANWASNNPTLGLGEEGYDSTNKHRFTGDGSTPQQTLPYRAAPLFTPPPTTGWSTVNLGAGSVAASGRDRLFTIPDGTGAQARAEYRTLSPASNYTCTIYLEELIYNSNGFGGGIFLRQSSDGKMIWFGPQVNATAFGIESWKLTSATVYSTQYGATWAVGTGLSRMPNWWRYRDDGTNRYAEFSNNGVDWLTYHTVGRTDFLTADQIGWGGDTNNAGFTNYLRLRSFAVT